MSKRRNLDAAQISSSRWSRHPIIASVCAVTTSSGERSSGANDVSLAASIPTCGPFPWVTTRRVRSAARPRTFAVSRIRCRWLSALWGPERGANALPPSPTTTVVKPIDGHPVSNRTARSVIGNLVPIAGRVDVVESNVEAPPAIADGCTKRSVDQWKGRTR